MLGQSWEQPPSLVCPCYWPPPRISGPRPQSTHKSPQPQALWIPLATGLPGRLHCALVLARCEALIGSRGSCAEQSCVEAALTTLSSSFHPETATVQGSHFTYTVTGDHLPASVPSPSTWLTSCTCFVTIFYSPASLRVVLEDGILASPRNTSSRAC